MSVVLWCGDVQCGLELKYRFLHEKFKITLSFWWLSPFHYNKLQSQSTTETETEREKERMVMVRENRCKHWHILHICNVKRTIDSNSVIRAHSMLQ